MTDVNNQNIENSIAKRTGRCIYCIGSFFVPGCITWGDTVEQALEMAKEAITGYIAVLQEEGEPVPDDNETLEYSLQLTA